MKKNQHSNNNSKKHTLLIDAARAGNLPEVKKLIEIDKVPIDETSDLGNTALLFAAQLGHFDIVEYLIQQGANPKHHNQVEEDAFFCAILGGNAKVIEYFIEKIPLSSEDINKTVLLFANTAHFNLDRLLFILKRFPTQIDDEKQLEALAENSPYIKKNAVTWTRGFHYAQKMILLERNAPVLKTLITTDRFETLAVDEDAMFSYLEKNSFIEELSYSHPLKNAENFKKLINFLACTTSLKKLHIRDYSTEEDVSIVKEIFGALIKNKNLVLGSLELECSCDRSDMPSVMTLADFLKQNKTCQIELKNYKLSTEAVKIIADAIRANPSILRTLSLCSVSIDLIGAKALASLLRDPRTVLAKLDISGLFKSSGDSIAEILAGAIENTRLSEIVLPTISTEISQAVSAIKNLIANNNTLTKLRLDGANFTDEHGEQIFDALRKNRGIKEIDFLDSQAYSLFQCKFSKKTALALNEVLKQNTTVEMLGLVEHKELGKYADCFVSAFAVNKSLKVLGLAGTDIDEESFIQLLRAIASSKALVSLHVSNLRGGEKSINVLAELLAGDKIPLRELSLIFDALDEKNYIVVFESLRKNTFLIELLFEAWSSRATVEASKCLIDVLRKDNFKLRVAYIRPERVQEIEINKLLTRNKQLAENLPKKELQSFSIFSGSEGKKEEEKTDEEKAFEKEVLAGVNQNRN